MKVEGIYKAGCGCRWQSKAHRDAGEDPTMSCGMHRKHYEVPPSAAETTVHSYDPPPAHYDGGSGIDNWTIWDAYDLDRYTANVVKYVLRAGKKSNTPRLDDLIKARNYIEKAIEMEKSKNGKDPEN